MAAATTRPATAADLPLIFDLVAALAACEKLTAEMDATREDFARALFGAQPRAFCEIAEWEGEAGGLALWFYNFSTFRGRHGIYLEDLYVRPALRRHGLGKALLRALAARCVRENLARFEWSVLDWNQPAIDFYRAHGAAVLEEWRICRLTGPALARLGAA